MSRTMPRILLLALAAVIILACGGVARAAEGRVALIVGNADYQHATRLATPANDAQDIAALLTSLGFDVVLQQNASADDLRHAFADFSEKSAQAEIAIVYFAGYGVGVGTEGFLIPVDADISTAASFQTQAVPIQVALGSAARARQLGLVILDAMRGNPFKPRPPHPEANPARAAQPGTVAQNALVFFAAEPGKTSVEGRDRNSPLAAALLKYLPARDLEINFLFRSVRDDVRTSTQQKQTPYMYGQLSGAKIFINDVAALKQASLAAHADPAAVQPCDRMASAPEDTSKGRGLSGVRLEDIKSDDAVKACSEAVRQYPGVDRFHYELGRSLIAAKDYPAAIDAYKRAYELGNMRALYALGTMYDEGSGVDKDPARARFYYEMAAQQKFAPAIVALAAHYEHGTGTAPDLAKALSLYQQAADLGEARALNKLGTFYEKGLGTEANATKARSNYEKAAKLGNDEAMVNLARCYVSAIGGKQDVGEARRWLNKAAEAGSAEAKRILASVDAARHK